MMWTRGGGRVLDALVQRRGEERALYLKPDGTALVPPVPITGFPNPSSPAADITDLIVKLQTALNDQTGSTLSVDGVLGPRTYQALQAWQNRRSGT